MHSGLHFRNALTAKISAFAAESPAFQKGYAAYGEALRKHFDPTKP